MNRRDFIRLATLAGAGLTFTRFDDKLFAHQKLSGINPLRFPPVLNPGDPLVLDYADVEVWPGTTSRVLTLNNSFPGPSVILKQGDNFSVEFRNMLAEESTIHWHGLIVPELMDGQPKDAIPPGGSYVYSFPVIQKSGTFFYHSHAHHLTAKQVYLGHAGFIIIEDEQDYGLPSGQFDVPLLIQDKHSIYQPDLKYSPTNMDVMQGYLGDVPIINGTPDPYLDVHTTLYRFRIVNGSNARVFNLAFSDNSPFRILATDGGLKDEAIEVNSVFLSPGERIEILFDFSGYSIGDSVYFVSLPFSGPGNQGIQMDLLKFNITGNQNSGGTVPQNLPAIEYYNFADIKRTRTFTLSQGMMMQQSGIHRINGLSYELNRIDEIIPHNELEEWKFVNNTMNYHPMHVHGVLFQVYARNGNTNLEPKDKGWKDTVLVNPNETVQVLVKFTDYNGIYLLHCHNLEHEDNGMMLNIKIDEPTGIDTDKNLIDNFELFQNYPNPFNPETKIKFSLPEKGHVKLSIFNSNGELVKDLLDGILDTGIHEIIFNGADLSSGVYFYKLTTSAGEITKKMNLIK